MNENRNEIATLDDQINQIESNISSKATNDIHPTDTVRLKQLEKKHKDEADSLKLYQTDPEKKAKLLHEENEKLLRNTTKERKKAENLQTDLDTEKGCSEELRERIETLERLWQTDHMYKSEAKAQKTNHTDLEEKVKQLQEENERHLQKESQERNRAENLQSKLHDEKRLTVELHAKIEELEKERMKFSEKQDAIRKQVSDEKDKEQIRIKRLEAFHKKETEAIQQKLAELQKKFNLVQEERDNLREIEETERNIGEKAQLELEDAKREKKKLQERIKKLERQITEVPKLDPYLSRENRQLKEEVECLRKEVKNAKQNIKQLEAFHKKETDTIQQKLIELQKKFHLIKEERDNLMESEETERQIGEKAQQKLEDAKREKEKLQERIKELERETPAIKTEEFDSLNLTSATASHEFHTIFKREWMDAFKVLSNSGLQENDILLGLHGLLTKCVGDAVLECSEITKRVCRYRYFQTDPSPTLVKMLKLAGLKAVVPHKTKQMLENISTEDHGIPIPVPLAVKTYVQRCTEMTLLVRMLFPQLSIVADMESSHLNTQQFEVFSGEGNLIDVVVWPYIMKNGTVVQKGYVKVRSSKQTPSVSKNKEGTTGISKSNDISDNEDHKYSDIERILIYKRDDEGKDESQNDTGSQSANSMAESLTNYDLTSDFLNSFSIRQQRREDDVAGK